MQFKVPRKTTRTRACPVTPHDSQAYGGIRTTNEGPTSFQMDNFFGMDHKGVFPIGRATTQRDDRQVTEPDAPGWAEYEPLDIRLAAQIEHAVALNGQQGKPGEYVVRSGVKMWIGGREVFEASEVRVAEHEIERQ